MSNFPCPTKSNCDCSDDPFANLTAEGFDQRGFFSIVHTNTWLGQCCTKVCESVVSQEAADACAQIVRMVAEQGGCDVVQQANGELTCADPTNTPTNPFVPRDGGPGSGDPNNPTSRPPINFFINNPQVGIRRCQGGFTYFDIIEDPISYAGQSQIEADRIAQSFAQIRAGENFFCCAAQTMVFCFDYFDIKYITLTGPGAPFTWNIGPLPDGLVFTDESGDGRTISIAGIPSIPGVTTVTALITNVSGNIDYGTFEIGVVDIQPDPLPTAQAGIPYPDTQLVCLGLPTGLVATFEITSGSLPDGLAMSADGIITGTPTGTGLPAAFTVAATFL